MLLCVLRLVIGHLGLRFVLLLDLPKNVFVKQLQFRNHQRAFNTLGRKIWKDRRSLRYGENLIHHRKGGVQTLGLMLTEMKCVVIPHSRGLESIGQERNGTRRASIKYQMRYVACRHSVREARQCTPEKLASEEPQVRKGVTRRRNKHVWQSWMRNHFERTSLRRLTFGLCAAVNFSLRECVSERQNHTSSC